MLDHCSCGNKSQTIYISQKLLWKFNNVRVRVNFNEYNNISFQKEIGRTMLREVLKTVSAFWSMHFLPSAQHGFKQEDNVWVKFRILQPCNRTNNRREAFGLWPFRWYWWQFPTCSFGQKRYVSSGSDEALQVGLLGLSRTQRLLNFVLANAELLLLVELCWWHIKT